MRWSIHKHLCKNTLTREKAVRGECSLKPCLGLLKAYVKSFPRRSYTVKTIHF